MSDRPTPETDAALYRGMTATMSHAMLQRLERERDAAREQRDRLAEILRETIAGYDVVSETISLCSGYVATVIDPALAAMKGGKP